MVVRKNQGDTPVQTSAVAVVVRKKQCGTHVQVPVVVSQKESSGGNYYSPFEFDAGR